MRFFVVLSITFGVACAGLYGGVPHPPDLPLKVANEITFQGLPFAMPSIPLPQIPSATFDIRHFGAVSGGVVKNTEAFAKTILVARASGGGRVLVPAGRWLTGPIHMKNHVALHLEEGAELLFSQEIPDYLPPVFTRWEGTECMSYSPLIYCRGCTDIAITGKGTLNGQGQSWWGHSKNKKAIVARLYEMAVQNVPVADRVFATSDNLLRPSFIQFIDSKRILIEGVTITNGPMWTIHPVYSEDIVVRRVTVKTEGPNGDGCDPDSVRNMLIEESFFSTRDDCIVIKSGLNEDGWRVGRPSENIVIRNVTFERGNGGIVIGSEMSGNVRRVFAENCSMNGTSRGLRIKSREGRGGVIEDVWYQNMKHRDLLREGIQITTYYGSSTVEPLTRIAPTVRRIHIRDVHGVGANQSIEILGLPSQPVREVSLQRVSHTGLLGAVISDVEDLRLSDVDLRSKTGPVFQIAQSRRVDLKGITCSGSSPCVSVAGSVSDGITIATPTGVDGNSLVQIENDVPQNAVKVW